MAEGNGKVEPERDLLRMIGNIQIARAELCQADSTLKRIENKLREDWLREFGDNDGRKID